MGRRSAILLACLWAAACPSARAEDPIVRTQPLQTSIFEDIVGGIGDAVDVLVGPPISSPTPYLNLPGGESSGPAKAEARPEAKTEPVKAVAVPPAPSQPIVIPAAPAIAPAAPPPPPAPPVKAAVAPAPAAPPIPPAPVRPAPPVAVAPPPAAPVAAVAPVQVPCAQRVAATATLEQMRRLPACK